MNAASISRAVYAAAAVLGATILVLAPVGFAGGSAASVSTMSPTSGQTISGKVTWQVDATGQVDHVDFLVDGVKKWTEYLSPYVYDGDGHTLDTTTLSNGQHSLQAVAYDKQGRSDSDTVTVSVANSAPAPAPTSTMQVSIATPSSGQTVSGKVVWTANVSGATPSKVSFFVDGQLRWNEYQAPYTFNGDSGTLDTTTLSNAAHTLGVVAYASSGSASTSISVTVANGSSTPTAAPAPLPAPTTTAPASTSPPAITGTAQVGSTLTSSTGTWSGTTPMTYATQWKRCTTTGCASISGATASTYAPTTADVGSTIRVAVTATNSVGSATALSAATATVTAPTTSPTSSPTSTSGGPTWPDTTPPAYTPNRVASTVSEFNTILGSLRAGDVVEVKPMTIGGEVVFGAKLSSPAEIHFDAGVKFTGAAAGSNLPGVWIHGSNLRLYGGEVSNLGNDCVRVQAASSDTSGPTNIRWWGVKIHDCAATGLGVHATGYPTTGIDIAAEIWSCGENLSLDPHAEKGTGLHGAYLGGGTLPSSGRFMLDVHDQPTGAAVQIGSNLQNSEVWVKAHRITFQATSQVAGNAVQFWGSNNKNVTVKDIEADTLAGRVIETDALSAGTGLVAQYARGTNVRLSPAYALGSYVSCTDCK